MKANDQKFLAILFDMDGVLINSRPVIENAWREVAMSYGRSISDEEMHQHVHGRSGQYTVDMLFADFSNSEKTAIRNRVDNVEERSDCSSIPGVEHFIGDLIASGIVFGLVTSGWPARINYVLQRLGLDGRFSVIISRDDVNQGKPHPDPYLIAASRLGVPASQTVVFEDSTSGVQAATQAGSYCVGIGDDNLINFGANIVIADFIQIKLQPDEEGISISMSAGHSHSHRLVVGKMR
jgi:sugar-phosphatase